MSELPPDQVTDGPLQLAALDELESLDAEALRSQVHYLQRLLLDVDSGYFEWHPQSGLCRAEGAVWSQFNPESSRAVEKLFAGEALALVHSDDRDRLSAMRGRLERPGGLADATFRAYDSSGHLRWLRIWARSFEPRGSAGNLAHFVIGGCADYTESLAGRDAASLPADRPLQTLAGVGDGLWEWDLRADEVLLDDACWALIGFEPGTMDADPRSGLKLWKRRILPEDYDRLKQAMQDHVQERIPLDVEYRLWHRDGSIVWLRCRGQVQCNRKDEPLRVLGTLQDVTSGREALSRAERELQSLRSESEHRAGLLFSLSHELRTPLNAILGYSQMVELDQTLSTDQRKRLLEIRRAGQHLLHLVGDVLELARIDTNRVGPAMEAVQPASLVNDCKRLLEPLAETRKVSLIFEPLGWESAFIRVDPVRFKQVVLNLAGNAVKYNREGGRVVMNFAPQSEGWLRLSILDTGSGIAEERRSEVFEPFNRLGAEKSQIEGTGVGLAIAKRLTEAMGGRIDFDSHEDQGSVFWIEFPLIDAPSDVLRLRPEPGKALTFPECCLLVVENRPAAVARLRGVLADAPQVKLLVAADVVEAIFTARSRDVDAVLFDSSVPGLSAADLSEVFSGDPRTAGIRLIEVGGGGCDAVDATLPTEYGPAELARALEKSGAGAQEEG
ncbi:PAS domain-containing sensor histidine kinase [Microbulbifer flavimaris]|uniref:histidine kinase n=1 Tax=Microbulbifer flavimaris TaxID=1781068 RepID=A0ABX4HWK7_9GAMM|nr:MULTISPECIES: HAMP domain-containing sensor histidine kinase [Microbulbifer]PCO04393.1 PAS domain-containing sensor histidine kinase [Microbulbifer flavimaris]